MDPKASPTPVHLRKLQILDVRSLGKLDIKFAVPRPDRGQWVLLLGDNGTGKSTILRSIALALADRRLGNSLLESLRGVPFVRNGAKKAKITVGLAGEETYREVRLTPDPSGRGESFGPSGEPARVPVFAYGCQRTTTRGSVATGAEVRSLFLEEPALLDGEVWLQQRYIGKLEDPKGSRARFFDAVRDTLLKLLPGVDEIEVQEDRVWLKGDAVGRAPMGALSDGYVTTARWVIDLIARWADEAVAAGLTVDGSFNGRMTGLVLVDELDLHLHPRWQTEVVRALRQAFPLLSFVATTHNPLTLLGADAGEVHVLRRDEESGTVEIRQADVPKGTRADQVLTGEWFGLPSTLDPETLDLLDRHRELLRAGRPAEDQERDQIEAQLRERLGSVADTSLERLALSAAAQVMSQDFRKLGPDDRMAIREKVLGRLRSARD